MYALATLTAGVSFAPAGCRVAASPWWLADEMAADDPAAVISKAALNGSCDICVHAMDIFVSVYGSEAGNLALKVLATGGVYIGGGIAPKIVEKLIEPTFMEGFVDKGRMRYLMEEIPVRVILNDTAALLGAARVAASAVPAAGLHETKTNAAS